MGIFKITKGLRSADVEKKRVDQQMQHILEQQSSDDEEDGSVMQQAVAALTASAESPKSEKKRFFKSKKRHTKKKRNNFQRLRTSCTSPVNAYVPPPGLTTSFSGEKPEEVDTSSQSDSSSTNSVISSETISRDQDDGDTMASGHVTVRRSKNSKKEYTALKPKTQPPAARGRIKKLSPHPKGGFLRLTDDKSVVALGASGPKGFQQLKNDDGSVSIMPPSIVESQETVDFTTSEEQSHQEPPNYVPPDFDLFVNSHDPFSDASTGQTTTEDRAINVVQDEIVRDDTRETTDSASSGGSSSSNEDASRDKFSERGNTEFRQFVFDNKFSRIVAVEKSDSGVADSFRSAAAALTMKLQSNGAKAHSPPPVFKRENSKPKVTTRLSEGSKFPSPRFPSPAPPKQTDQKQTERPSQSENLHATRETRRFMNKVSDDRSENATLTESTTEFAHAPPKAIVTSSEFTVVSNMSATHVTHETSDRTDKSSLPQYNSFVIPESKEREEENDPFQIGVLSEVDDTLWETDQNPFGKADKSTLKYQGGQLKKSNSADDALITSIRMATKKECNPAARKPDPSPRAVQTSKSDDGLCDSSYKRVKTILVPTEALRDKALKKKRGLAQEPAANRKSEESFNLGSDQCSRCSWDDFDEAPAETAEDDLSTASFSVSNGDFKINDVHASGVHASEGAGESPRKRLAVMTAQRKAVEKLSSSSGPDIGSPEANDQAALSDPEGTHDFFASPRASVVSRPAPSSPDTAPELPFSPRRKEQSDAQHRLSDADIPPSPNTETLGIASPPKEQSAFLLSPSSFQDRPASPFSPCGSPSGPMADYSRVLSAFAHSAAPAPENDKNDEPLGSMFESPKSTSQVNGSFNEPDEDDEDVEEDADEKENVADNAVGAKERVQNSGMEQWQRLGSGESSIYSNPSGVPSSAIAASMLFQAAHPESTPVAGIKEEDAQDAFDEDVPLPDVPPAVDVRDNTDAMSSITEEASTFYQKSFQLWSKTAHNAINNIQKGAFARNPSQYRSQGYSYY